MSSFTSVTAICSAPTSVPPLSVALVASFVPCCATAIAAPFVVMPLPFAA